jgi:hypothetical protein
MRRFRLLLIAAIVFVILSASASAEGGATGTIRIRFLSAPHGTVSSRPAGINCRSRVISAGCQHAFAAGTRLTLSVRPAPGYVGVWRCETVSKRTDQPGGTTCTFVVKPGRTVVVGVLWSKASSVNATGTAVKDAEFGSPGGNGLTVDVVKGKIVTLGWFRTPCQEGTDLSISMTLAHPLKTAVPVSVGSPFTLHEVLDVGAISVGGGPDGGTIDIRGTFTTSTKAHVHVSYHASTPLGACTVAADLDLTAA